MAHPPFKVKALYEYSSPHEDDLSFPDGQIITVTEEEDTDWYVGEYTDSSGAKQDGLFPKNFVEKFEPEIPIRPNRASRIKPAEAPPALVEPPVEQAPPSPAPAPKAAKETPKPVAPPVEIPMAAKEMTSPTSPPSASFGKSPQIPQELPAAPKPAPAAPAPTSAKSPPAVAPKSSSFKDRIAAFNKPAAAPIAPFKPGGAPSTFIKKPFVAPPPSRDAYVPPPRDPVPQKVYRREEDPEIAERRARDQEAAERAGLTSHDTAAAAEEEGEEAPKPTSLKDRIALLQKQQMEAAQRQAASHKEKPKRPPKKRTESYEKSEAHESEDTGIERVNSGDTGDRISMDMARPPRAPSARRQSHIKSPESAHQETFSDANDADQSAAGETTEDAEGTSTSVEDDEEKPMIHPKGPTHEPEVGDEEDTTENAEEEEEDEMDAETRRRLELRERMAKMSGGMGMPGMFGPPGGMPMGGAPPKKKVSKERKSTEDSDARPAYSPPPVQRMPMIPVPGMPHVRSPESEDTQLAVEPEPGHPMTSERAPDEVPDIEDVKPGPPSRVSTQGSVAPPPPPHQERILPPAPTERKVPPVPGDRPVPPPPESRPVPPPGAVPQSPSPGSESDDEMTGTASDAQSRAVPPVPVAMSPQVPRRPTTEAPTSPQQQNKRLSRGPPPIPMGSPAMSPPGQARPPPPPPPTAAPPSRQPTSDSLGIQYTSRGQGDEGETEYEGDYDTDIAPGAAHKDALKSHARESSLDDSTTADDTPIRSPSIGSPTVAPPPIPQFPASRPVPPPPPGQPPSRQSVDTRRSTDVPRGAPPPPPREQAPMSEDDEDYDPYRYTAPPPMHSSRAPPPAPSGPPPVPMVQAPAESSGDEDDMYSHPPPPPPQAPPHQERAAPPLPPSSQYPPPPPPPPASAAPTTPSAASTSRKSLDVNRHAAVAGRRSMEQPRPSTDTGFMANEVDLAPSTVWWATPNLPPPVFQNRRDLLIEYDETTSTRRGGKTMVNKDVYVLFLDYSQTVITANFDAHNIADCSLEQRQEKPPPALRQDQLEDAHERYGRRIVEQVNSMKEHVVGDGAPSTLILELLKQHPTALQPVGVRAYGACVYANLANASVLQHDEIRPGDIITFRNAKFQGKHGAMHKSYVQEVGLGVMGHQGVVAEWDGTKKKVRVWEQGREEGGKRKGKKVEIESYRVSDMRSGEVRVWRVMGRGWVGWDGEN